MGLRVKPFEKPKVQKNQAASIYEVFLFVPYYNLQSFKNLGIHFDIIQNNFNNTEIFLNTFNMESYY
jgi:hypothetical protein